MLELVFLFVLVLIAVLVVTLVVQEKDSRLPYIFGMFPCASFWSPDH